MTLEETMGALADRFGRRVTVTVSGRSERGPASAMSATGTLKPGWNETQLAASVENGVERIFPFRFDELDDTAFYVDAGEFRDAALHGDRLTIHVGEDVEFTVEPPMLDD